jgi:hypothetical protein
MSLEASPELSWQTISAGVQAIAGSLHPDDGQPDLPSGDYTEFSVAAIAITWRDSGP